ncbi:Zn(II)2Cys6 transcription factor, partial [Sporobolomyces salmoneus]|uniref:Zn(II)2Cys6 transcription factor n=1 Tax=Sporobolomyces salmoneus TaxID=183962 RepID=UPI00317A9925
MPTESTTRPSRSRSPASSSSAAAHQTKSKPRTASTSSSSTTTVTGLPPILGPDGKPLQGNALTNAIKGGIRVETANGGERTSRACLACRKLKTRCDGAEEPPCKRCRAGGHECVFVESKRGKRPPKDKKNKAAAQEPTLADKFRQVEKSLSEVLDSIGSGERPDPGLLSQLQASLAEGGRAADISTQDRRGSTVGLTDNGESPTSSDENGGGGATNPRANKRARYGSLSASSVGPFESPQGGFSIALSPSAPAPLSTSSHVAPLPPLTTAPDSVNSNHHRQLSQTPSHPSPSHPSPAGTNGSSLSLLADASLAAQIDGRSRLTGLDPSFKLSTVTNAIQRKDENGFPAVDGDQMRTTGTTPAVLSKGIVTPELAVELFTIFFDFAYIHLPLLDPARHTAPWVCQKSAFLFTVILAVASRFHSDPNLHNKIYEEAHQCFVDCLSEGERSSEAVQACCILTVWTYPPKGEGDDAGREERPKRAWLYFGMAVRLGLELNLFRPPAWVDYHLSKPGNSARNNPWINLPRSGPEAITDEDVWDALNKERTWLMVFVIDRNMSAVMGRPHQIHEAKALLIPLHPACLPFDLGVIAHVELQTIIGQVMDTFRDRLYGLSSASDDMPSPVVMKLFNSRMDEWKMRWCPMPGEPIANNLLFYFYSSKLFLNTIPLHTMLRNGDAADDPDSVSSTISAAKSLLSLGHAYADLSVLRHCPDVNFLLMLYAAVFLVKVRVSNSRFSELVASDELEQLLLTVMRDCQVAAQGDLRHSAMTCLLLTRALGVSWKALENGGKSRATSIKGEGEVEDFANQYSNQNRVQPLHSTATPQQHQSASFQPVGGGLDGTLTSHPQVSLAGHLPGSPAPMYPSNSMNPFTNPFAASSTTHTPLPSYRSGIASGPQTPSVFGQSGGSAFPGLDGSITSSTSMQNQPSAPPEGVDNFLSDSHFFNSLLIGQGASGYFNWQDTNLPSFDAFDPEFNWSFDPIVTNDNTSPNANASGDKSTLSNGNGLKMSVAPRRKSSSRVVKEEDGTAAAANQDAAPPASPKNLLSLPNDLLLPIFEEVYKCTGKVSPPVAEILINKRIFNLARPIWFSRLRIDLEGDIKITRLLEEHIQHGGRGRIEHLRQHRWI